MQGKIWQCTSASSSSPDDTWWHLRRTDVLPWLWRRWNPDKRSRRLYGTGLSLTLQQPCNQPTPLCICRLSVLSPGRLPRPHLIDPFPTTPIPNRRSVRSGYCRSQNRLASVLPPPPSMACPYPGTSSPNRPVFSPHDRPPALPLARRLLSRPSPSVFPPFSLLPASLPQTLPCSLLPFPPFFSCTVPPESWYSIVNLAKASSR